MKFKISQQFLSQIKTYLDGLYPTYNWSQPPDSQLGTLTLDNTQELICGLENTIAQALLAQLHKEKASNPELTVGEWLHTYASCLANCLTNMPQPQQQELSCDYLNHILLAHSYSTLKNRILTKRQTLSSQLLTNSQLRHSYSIASEPQSTKIQLSLDNIEYKVKLVYINQEHSNQELERITNLLRNNLWGIRHQLQGKLEQITKLQTEIAELNQIHHHPN